MDENPDKGINKNDRIPDLKKGASRRSGNKKTSPKDGHGSDYDPFLPLSSARRSPDGFPMLSGNDRKRGPRSDSASDFWSQGVANWRALDTRSNGHEKTSDSAALVNETGYPPTDKDTAKSLPTYSRDQLDRSRIPSFLESDGTSASSSGVDHLARPVPDSSVTVFDEIPDHKNEPLCPSLENPMESLAPDVGTRDQSLEIHSLELRAQKRRRSISASVSDSPTKPPGGKDYDSLMGADVPLHAGRAGSTITSHPEVEDDLQGSPGIGNLKPAISAGPECSDGAYSRPGWGTGPLLPKQRGNAPYTPPKLSQAPKHNESSSAKAASHLSEPRSVTPITPTRIHRIRHPNVETPAFHPSPPSSSPTTPTGSYSKGHGRSVSIGTGHSNPSYVSVMPNTPISRRGLQSSRQSSMGTPSVPVGSGAFSSYGGASQPLIVSHYPTPHQHTPERQGQCFNHQEPTPLPLPIHFRNYLGPIMSPFSSPMHPSSSNTIRYNTQVYKQGEQNAEYSQPNHFDSYAAPQVANAGPNAADLHQNGNMYTQDTNSYGPRYYSNHADPSHQVHFYPMRIDNAELIKN